MLESPSTSVYATTTYDYDARGNLKTVHQGEQTRSFTYDGLSRLKSAINPEVCQQGQTACTPVPVTYTYDAGGNLKRKTDARNITTTYDYDALGRVTSRTYSDSTPAVAYFYDSQTLPSGAPDLLRGKSIGRLIAVTYGGGALGGYTGGYDAMGRPKLSRQVTDTGTAEGVQTYKMGYEYDLAGNLKSETYPSQRKVTTEYDAAGRVAGVKNPATGLYYAGGDPTAANNQNVIAYSAAGAALTTRLGNGLWEHTTFNSRLQPTQIGLGTSTADSSVLKLDYTYGVVIDGTPDPTRNNGNVQSQTITVPGLTTPFVQSYEYDAVNRLQSAEEKSGTVSNWKQVYSYDRFGNRNFAAGTTTPDYSQTANDSVTGLPIDPVRNPVFDASNNRIKVTAAGQGDYKYDSAGNLLCDPSHQCVQGQSSLTPYYGYDAESKMTNSGGTPTNGGTSYIYDGGGQRVKKVSGVITRVFVYDAAGKLVAEYGGEAPQTSGTSYVTQDNLGSTRVITGQGPTDVRGRYDYLPFGEELYVDRSNYGGSNDIQQKFTGKERDEETGLDYFIARYFSSVQGRFTSSDPLLASARPALPQSWNRYSYVLNNPLRLIDPDGLADDDPQKKRGGESKSEERRPRL